MKIAATLAGRMRGSLSSDVWGPDRAPKSHCLVFVFVIATIQFFYIMQRASFCQSYIEFFFHGIY